MRLGAWGADRLYARLGRPVSLQAVSVAARAHHQAGQVFGGFRRRFGHFAARLVVGGKANLLYLYKVKNSFLFRFAKRKPRAMDILQRKKEGEKKMPLRAVALVMPQLASVAHLALAAGVCRAWRSVIGSEAEVIGRIHSANLNCRPGARIGATHTAHCRLVSIGHNTAHCLLR